MAVKVPDLAAALVVSSVVVVVVAATAATTVVVLGLAVRVTAMTAAVTELRLVAVLVGGANSGSRKGNGLGDIGGCRYGTCGSIIGGGCSSGYGSGFSESSSVGTGVVSGGSCDGGRKVCIANNET